jgi:peptide/nickel transport system substrate-binding protein
VKPRSSRWFVMFVVVVLAIAGCGTSTSSGSGLPAVSSSSPSSGSSSPSSGSGTPAVGGSTTPKTGGELHVAVAADIKTLDPHLFSEGVVRAQLSSLYDRALDLDPITLQLEPALITKWEWADPKTLNVTVRSDVKFHNGAAFTADDLKWNIDRVRDPKTGSPWTGSWSVVTDVTLVDSTHLTLHLSAPSVGLAFQFTYLWIMPKNGDPNAGIGTGPFKLDKWTPNVSLRLVKNDLYWRPNQPLLDAVTFLVLPEVEARYAALQSGDVDVVYDAPATDVPRFKGAAGITTNVAATMDLQVIVHVNTLRPGLNNQKVRQALAYATDRVTFMQQFTAGLGIPGNSAISPGSWAYSKAVDTLYTYDLAKARQLLADAGYPNGQGLPVFTFLVPTGYPVFESGSEMMQASLAKIGITTKIETVDAAVWDDRLFGATKNYDLSWDYPGRGATDPDFLLKGPVYGAGPANLWGVTATTLPDYVKEVQAGGAVSDQSQRVQHYVNALTDLLNFGAPIVVGHEPIVVLTGSYVMGLVVHPLQLLSYGAVWLNR